MYVFELFYRPKISPVSIGHHMGTILIGQSAIAISLNLVRESDATIEFILCTVWGTFLQFIDSLLYSSVPCEQSLIIHVYRCLRHCFRISVPRLDHPLSRIPHVAQIPLQIARITHLQGQLPKRYSQCISLVVCGPGDTCL